MAKIGLMLAALFVVQDKMVDNPAYQSWKDCKPGSWAKIKMTIVAGDNKMETFVTQKLVEFTAEKAVIEATTEAMGKAQTVKKDIPAQVKEGEVYDLPKGATFEKTAEGDEELEVAGKKVKCHFFEGKAVRDGETTTCKFHYSKDVIGGLVKATMKGGKWGDMTMEFVESKKE